MSNKCRGKYTRVLVITYRARLQENLSNKKVALDVIYTKQPIVKQCGINTWRGEITEVDSHLVDGAVVLSKPFGERKRNIYMIQNRRNKRNGAGGGIERICLRRGTTQGSSNILSLAHPHRLRHVCHRKNVSHPPRRSRFAQRPGWGGMGKCSGVVSSCRPL